MSTAIELQRVLNLCDPRSSWPWDCEPPEGATLRLLLATADEVEVPVKGAGSPREHIGRIRYLARCGWSDPIELDVGIPVLGCSGPSWPVVDGNHRLWAATIRGDASIQVSVAGQVDHAAHLLGVSESQIWRQGAEMREEPEEPITFPLVARGLILDRQMYGAHIKPAPAVAGPAFDAAVQEWLEGKARYLLFVQRSDGRAIIWETSDLDTLRRTHDHLLLEFEARRLVCLIDPLVADPLRFELDQRGERHALEMSVLFEQGEKPREGLTVVRGAIEELGDVVVLTVDRGVTEKGQVYGLLRELDRLVSSPEAIAKHWQRVFVSFDGYDDDPREIFEIPQIRAFIGKVTEAAPWWLGLIAQTDQIAWLASIAELDNVARTGGAHFTAKFKPQALERAVSEALLRLGPLLRCARFKDQSLVDDLMRDVSMAMTQLLVGQQQPSSRTLH